MPVDVSDHEYELLVQTSAGTVHVPYLGLSYEDDPNEVGMKVRLQVPDQPTDEWDPSVISNGAAFVLNGGPPDSPIEICRGTILGVGTGLTAGEPIQPRGYSLMYALLKSRMDYFYAHKETGADIIADLCQQWGVPVDSIDGPSVVVAPLTGRRKQIADVFRSVLARAKAQGDGSYVMRSGPNGFQCVRPGGNTTVYLFKDDESVLGGSLDSSVEDLVTRVKVLSPTNDTSDGTVKRDAQGRFVSLEGGKKVTGPQEIASVDGHTEFGIFQDIVYAKKGTGSVDGIQLGRQRLLEAGQPVTTIELEVPLLADVRKGDRHHVIAGPLDTYLLVDGLSADVGSRTMRLTMSAEWKDAFSTADLDTTDTSDVSSTMNAVHGGGVQQFNPNVPAVVQSSGWTCSCASAAWALQSSRLRLHNHARGGHQGSDSRSSTSRLDNTREQSSHRSL